MIAWNSRRFLDNRYLLFIGIAYCFVGGLDLLHTLAYKGMGVFQVNDANTPTQLWIAARYVESLSLLIAPFFLGRKLKIPLVFGGYAAVSFLLVGSIFFWNIFPACFIEGSGLTTFKKISEYIIALMFAASIVLLLGKRQEFDKDVLRLLVLSIGITIASELAFTFYIHVYGFSNLVGHYLKIISFYFIYKAIIVTGLERPYGLLFKNLKLSEEVLKEKADQLEVTVQERTEELQASLDTLRKNEEMLRISQKDLRKLAGKLISAQEVERRRVARELHDDLTQRLAVLAIEIGKLEQWPEIREPVLHTLRDLKNELINISEDVHNMSRQLHPSIIEDLGLVRAIASECATFSKREGIQVTFVPHTVPESIPRDVSLCLYRIIQEALGNAAKHSRAQEATVALSGDDGGVTLSIRDNGIGFDPAEVRQKRGLGLASMRERARLVEGNLSIHSGIGKGTTVEARVPLSRGEDEKQEKSKKDRVQSVVE